MSDKKALFSGRSGSNSSSFSSGRRKPTTEAEVASPPPPPPPPTGERKSRSSPMYSRGAGARGIAATAERRNAQLKEAVDNRKAANKCLQKTMTRWNPDFFSAAPLFEKAAMCYRAAGDENTATAMFITAGECHSHESVMAPASAAKDFREAALITERQGRGDEAAALYLRCAEAWVHADEAGRAAEYLGRSAKLVESDDEDAASERYIQASKVMVPEGSDATTNFVRVVGGTDILVQGIRFLASVDRLEDCMGVVERYCIILLAEGIEHSLGRMYLTYCVLALARGDYVRADAAFRDVHLQNTSYLRSEECRVEEDLLTAFREFKPDFLLKTQSDRMIRKLEPPIVKLAKSLRIEGDEGEILASNTPSGTIGDVKARVGALQEKYAGSVSSPSLSSAVSAAPEPPRRPSATPSAAAATAGLPPSIPRAAANGGQSPPVAAEGAGRHGEGDDAAAKGELFGVVPVKKPASKQQPLLTSSMSSPLGATTWAASGTPFHANGNNGAEDGDIGLDLGDLEASLAGEGGGGRGDDDDLEAMIEAAKKEAESFGGLEEVKGVVGTFDDEEEEDEEEDDIDLT